MKEKRNKTGNVPNLRFKGFGDEWEGKTLRQISKLITKGTTPSNFTNQGVRFIKIECFYNDIIDESKCLFIDEQTHNKELRRSILEENDLLFAIAGATVGKVNVVHKELLPANTNQALAIIRLIEKENWRFIYQILKSGIMRKYIQESISVGAQPNLNLEQINNFSFFQPDLAEQQKIASFLTLIDERIATQSKIIKELKLLKIRTRNLLFEDIHNKENKRLPIKDILEYEQPTKYLVTDTNYSSDKSLLPVLTANKAFILGYTDENFGIYDKDNCIIFDDFTMDVKYVDFRFKVKSSAIKILTAKPNVNLRFVFEYLSFLNLQSTEHKRHYISEIEPMYVALPDTNVQNNIANFLTAIDEKLTLEMNILKLLTQQKKYLLQNLFI